MARNRAALDFRFYIDHEFESVDDIPLSRVLDTLISTATHLRQHPEALESTPDLDFGYVSNTKIED